MVETMCDGDALNRLVEGTEMASMISQAAPSQREGVRASLNLVADALRLLKTRKEATTTWTAREWATKRQGWIFLTSTPELRAPLQPLLSVWLDLLVLRLMNTESGPQRRVWFVFDELGSLQKLPQLSTALTESRKSNNPVVIGVQGKSQVETLYGHLAEAMLSQPWTKIFLKTSEPRAAKWVSDAIGEQDREWLRESRTSGMHRGQQGRDSRTYLVAKKTIPLVLPAEISGVAELHGYLKNGNDVVEMSFPKLGDAVSLQNDLGALTFRPIDDDDRPGRGNEIEIGFILARSGDLGRTAVGLIVWSERNLTFNFRKSPEGAISVESSDLKNCHVLAIAMRRRRPTRRLADSPR